MPLPHASHGTWGLQRCQAVFCATSTSFALRPKSFVGELSRLASTSTSFAPGLRISTSALPSFAAPLPSFGRPCRARLVRCRAPARNDPARRVPSRASVAGSPPSSAGGRPSPLDGRPSREGAGAWPVGDPASPFPCRGQVLRGRSLEASALLPTCTFSMYYSSLIHIPIPGGTSEHRLRALCARSLAF
jgi:hypothetical protein